MYITSVPPRIPQALSYYEMTLTNTVSNTSTSFSADGLQLTPEAGHYYAIFTTDTFHSVSGVNNIGEIGIFVAGSLVTGATARFGINASGISLASFSVTGASVASTILTVDGTQIVQTGFREVQGTTVSLGTRQLLLLRIA